MHHVHVEACRGQRRVSNPLELEATGGCKLPEVDAGN